MFSGQHTRKALYVLSYCLPSLGRSILFAPLLILGGLYAKYFGLSLAEIAFALFLARMVDAVSDPIIGSWSDRLKMRYGTRKPMMAVGVLLMGPCAYFLYVPLEEVGATYFAFWYIAFYLAYTIAFIPYTAWGNEFTADSNEKVTVFSGLHVTANLGVAIFYVLPLLPLFETTEITPSILKAATVLGSGLLVLGMFIALWLVPDDLSSTQRVVIKQSFTQAALDVVKQLMSMGQNKPFLNYLAATLFAGIATGMYGSLMFVYVDAYLEMGEVFSKASLLNVSAGLASVAVWYFLCRKIYKAKVAAICMFFFCIAFLAAGSLRPGTSHELLYAFFFLVGCLASGNAVTSGPLLCDVIDYGALGTGRLQQSGQYFSMFSFIVKMEAAIGGAVGFFIAGLFGFEVNAAVHSESSVAGLRAAAFWLPAFFMVCSSCLYLNLRLNENRMDVVRRRLKQKQDRSQNVAGRAIAEHVAGNRRSIANKASTQSAYR